ncbi:MAG: 50S ribosomal protein L32, partial [Deltaproteobacteria bacterium]|nr:50S ribosomal protein L32 [Deltaproteobacteria bacterium]
MAVPKHRKSRARRDQRRAHHNRIDQSVLSACPRCQEAKLSHCVCKNCGYYGGKDVLRLEGQT